MQWQNVENIAKGAVEERKIRVVFLPADGAAATPHKQVNGTVSSFQKAYQDHSLIFE